jgi:arylsulfatase A-like enzyme
MGAEISRRDVLRAGAAAPMLQQSSRTESRKPNIVVIISDQFRGDCLGAAGHPMGLTPNLDRMAARGTMFRSAVCSQPVCAPTRASLFTGQYPERHGVWKNALSIQTDAKTLATACRDAGYSANYIGKWHLGLPGGGAPDHAGAGPVPPQLRGGFLNLWEAANELEWTSHPYEGDLFDGDGKAIHFEGMYRTDFMTQRAQAFLKNASAKDPFLLVMSYLEVHHQNDIDAFVPPKEYAGKYKNPFVPQDLRPLPGSWMSQLADYYGCVAKMDETVGTLLKSLEDNHQLDNTIVMFLSDHGCHFKTRNAEYKRSPHESSIHIPMIVQGPGFDRGIVIPEVVSHVDVAPSLLSAVGVSVPSTMQGHNFMPLLERKSADWRNEAYITMSENMTGRILRTPEWTYAVAAPKKAGWKAVPSSTEYNEYMMYDLKADPYQHVNLAGRVETRAVAAKFRVRMLERIEEASGVRPQIGPVLFPYS